MTMTKRSMGIVVLFLLLAQAVFADDSRIAGKAVIPGAPGVVNGDVNGDSIINLTDVLYNMRTLTRISNQAADFGDLDDASTNFPTTLGTQNAAAGRTGPYHRNVSHEWIGSGPSSTTDTELDAKTIDLDFDDADFDIYPISSNSQPTGVGVIRIPIGTDSDTAVRYLNVAADLNNDGRFQSYGTLPNRQHEWIVVNLPIQHQGGQRDISTSFALTDPNALIAFPCIRITLTTEMIDPALFGDNGWDGSGPAGGFARGETEDWCFGPQGETVTTTYDWPLAYGIQPPVWEVPPLQWPEPEPPIYDPPDNPVPPGFAPPGGKIQDGGGNHPVTQAPGPMAEPAGFQKAFKKQAHIPEMIGTKQEGDYDCAPTCGSNSVTYLLEKARLIGDIQEAAYSENPETAARIADSIFEGIPEWPNHAEEFVREKLKQAMKDGGMMDAANNKGTTPDGFLVGKKAASNALKAAAGIGLTTKGRENACFNNIFQAVSKGRDVEVVLTFKPESTPPEGHMVIVTGATMDHNGNLTLTFVDPLHREKGEQTYTVGNGAEKGSDTAVNKSGLEVKNYPGSGGKRAVITHLFEEYLTDSTESGGGGGVIGGISK
ncbi:hypothetical protein SAMN02745216_01089 [Desulfatibacillum alkenivorans DSM 16219]|uniref:Peptidase C39-like domain-containing protein n=1 Tax=Desulfatibacillum alkenivorans DSM 16219 TaxID=1121393 RepID=A0A1M6GS74_9BACT|nr:hypothetical protein [Desulfatibacillum alkenivorans]SHJ12706.1 hypothetical protein SAMN02745216_01089 [Desulfatibacillum alkenivorans DSM 16219]